MTGSGFENDLLYAKNGDFSNSAQPAFANGLQGDKTVWMGHGSGDTVDVVTLTAGGGITLTRGANTLTIAQSGGGTSIDSVAMQTGTSPVFPDVNGLVTFNGAVVAAGTNPVRTDGTAANTMALEVQISQAIAATDSTKIGLSNFDSAYFTVDANGFVSPTSALTADLHTAKFIVGDLTRGANYTTILSAYAAAAALGGKQTVFLQPGTYTEDITLTGGINLSAFPCDGTSTNSNVIIKGNLSFTSNNEVSISGIQLQTNGGYGLTVVGSAGCRVRIYDCMIYAFDHDFLSFSSVGGTTNNFVDFDSCRGELVNGFTYFKNLAGGAGTIGVYNCVFNNTGVSTTPSTNIAGTITINNSLFNNYITNSSTSGITIYNSQYFGALILGGSGTQTLLNSLLSAGASSSISAGTTVTVANCVIDSTNTNAITGAGTIQFCNLTFSNTSSLINTTTQIPLVSSNDALKIVTPGAYPYTTTAQDALIKVDTSSARTITPLASPTVGQKHIIKDTVGSAAANNITITPSGKNIDGAASATININYGSATIVYTGTEWSSI